MQKIIILLILTILLLNANYLSGTTYYVKTNGSNAFNGTNWQTAWQTIGYASVNVSAGDIVIMSNGYYKEEVFLWNNGNSGNPIIFQAFNIGTVIIDGENIRNYGFQFSNKNNIVIDGFFFKNQVLQSIRIEFGSTNIIIKNNTFISNGSIYVRDLNTRDILISNNSFSNSADGLRLRDSQSNKIIHNYFSFIGGIKNGIHLENNSSYNIISNNICYRREIYLEDEGCDNNFISSNKLSRSSINISEGDNNLIYNNVLASNYIRLSQDSLSNILKGNICYSNSYGILIGSEDTDNNFMISNILFQCSYGILFMSGADRNQILDNRIYLNDQQGIYLAGACQSNIIANNIIYSNSIDGIYIAVGSLNIISNNSIWGQNNSGIYFWSANYNIIKNNHGIYKNTPYGIYLTQNSTNTKIFKNSIYSNGTGVFLNNGTSITDTAKNNIYDNSTCDFNNSSGSPVIITNNWWETTISTNIKKKLTTGAGINYIPYRLFGPFDINENADTETLPVISWVTAQVPGFQVELTWNKTSGGDFHHYNVYHSTTPGRTNLTKTNIIARVFNINSTNYTHTGAHIGTNYYWITASDNYPAYTNECWYSPQASAVALHGGPFYVATSGDDSNNGTFSDPFRTVQKAVDIMSSGRPIPTCYIFPGAYSESIIIYSNNNNTNMIITKLSNTNPIFSGSFLSNFCIKIRNTSRVVISGLDICKFSNGIVIDGIATNNIIQKNTIYSNVWVGIYIDSDQADNNQIKSNNISGPGQNTGIFIESGDNNIITFNNIFHHTIGVGITSNAAFNNIFRNTIYSNDLSGIIVFSGPTYNVIGTNYIYGLNQDYGIYMYKTEYNIIQSNRICNNQQYGIHFWDQARHNEIINNIIYSNSNAGIYFNVTWVNFNIIKKNKIYGWNQSQGIWIHDSDRNSIISNIIYQNQNTGINLTGTSVNNTIKMNTIYSNDLNGLMINSEQAENNQICTNVIYGGNQDNGIYIFQGDDNIIIANIINFSQTNGILIEGSTNSIIKCNNIYNNPQGICYVSSLSPVYQNSITNNTVGFLYKGSKIDKFSKNNVFNNTINVSNAQSGSIKLTNNWWGTTIAGDIQAKIKGQSVYSNFIPYRLFGKVNTLEGADIDGLPVISSATCFLTYGEDVNLSWNRANNTSGDFSKYFIYRTNVPGYTNLTRNNVKIIINNINTTNYIDNPDAGTWYYYITALDDPQPPSGSVHTNESWYCEAKGNITILPHNIIVSTNTNYPDRIISGSSNNIPVLSFSITDERGHDIQTIKISNPGDMTNERDIENLKLWYDVNGNYNWDTGDSFIANANWNSVENKWIFSSLSIKSGTNLLTTIDITLTAVHGKTFRAKILPADIICERGGTNINMVSNTGTITLIIPHKIELIKTNISHYQTSVSKTNQPLLAFTYSDSFEHNLTNLRITLLGNISPGIDISNMKIFYDSQTIGKYDGTDVYITNLYFNSNSNKWTNESLVINNFSDLLITIDTLPTFRKSRSFRAGITSTNDVEGTCGLNAYYTITNSKFITSDTQPPDFKGILSATLTNKNKVILKWDLASDNCSACSKIGYNIYTALSSGDYNFSNPDRSIINNNSVKLSNLSIGQTYYFMVRAVDELGNKDSNATEKFVKISGAKDDFSEVKIYPNPGYQGEILKINNLTEKGEIKIFTLSKNLVKKINFNSIVGSMEINLNELNLASGMYILIFISDGIEIERRKFVFINKLR